ncbi:hypothetical protein ACQ4WP_28690 [Janthinobacterium sp. GB4P2]|uniref:hypothetical protein n=1 Tax=Janthinobacterium sp. GB4P2 TaxID=3424189 RepID=UPI003F2166EB
MMKYLQNTVMTLPEITFLTSFNTGEGRLFSLLTDDCANAANERLAKPMRGAIMAPAALAMKCCFFAATTCCVLRQRPCCLRQDNISRTHPFPTAAFPRAHWPGTALAVTLLAMQI